MTAATADEVPAGSINRLDTSSNEESPFEDDAEMMIAATSEHSDKRGRTKAAFLGFLALSAAALVAAGWTVAAGNRERSGGGDDNDDRLRAAGRQSTHERLVFNAYTSNGTRDDAEGGRAFCWIDGKSDVPPVAVQEFNSTHLRLGASLWFHRRAVCVRRGDGVRKLTLNNYLCGTEVTKTYSQCVTKVVFDGSASDGLTVEAKITDQFAPEKWVTDTTLEVMDWGRVRHGTTITGKCRAFNHNWREDGEVDATCDLMDGGGLLKSEKIEGVFYWSATKSVETTCRGEVTGEVCREYCHTYSAINQGVFSVQAARTCEDVYGIDMAGYP